MEGGTAVVDGARASASVEEEGGAHASIIFVIGFTDFFFFSLSFFFRFTARAEENIFLKLKYFMK